MSKEESYDVEERQPLTAAHHSPRQSEDELSGSAASASTTSLVLESLNKGKRVPNGQHYRDDDQDDQEHLPPIEEFDIEDSKYYGGRPADTKTRKLLWIIGAICVVGWSLALVMFLIGGGSKRFREYIPDEDLPQNSSESVKPVTPITEGPGNPVSLDSVQHGLWRPRKQSISWIAGANGEDGLLLERGLPDKDYLVVEDVRHRKSGKTSSSSITLMKDGSFKVGSASVFPDQVWPSPDFKKVLIKSSNERNWRHSSTGLYWIFDVARQHGQALDPAHDTERIQLASWSPQSDAIVFTRNNDMFLRKLNSDKVIRITKDGGPNLFYGVPDWVYEEEVFSGDSATWWSDDGKYIAFLRTNESEVPSYPVQYFLSRPSGEQPEPGLENYPEVRDIKYPKAGAPNPTVHLQFYDIRNGETFSVNIKDDFADSDRLITEIIWAGESGQVLARETNRESDTLKMILIDVKSRSGKTVRSVDVKKIDGGWFEVSETTTFIPADPRRGRQHDGYVDTVVHDGFDHLAYFTPLDNPKPVILTSGEWEVVEAPSAVDLDNNLVYFVATKEGSLTRHVYAVGLDGVTVQSITESSKEAYYEVGFSAKAGYALLSYDGPDIPWQRIISTPSHGSKYEEQIEDNQELRDTVQKYDLPENVFHTVKVDGVEMNVLERRPPNFDENKVYPVLFQLYGGPGSQEVHKKFRVDFQSYVASSLGYIVVTVDGRGTGFLGRDFRCVIRGNIGYYESRDQIEVAKIWSKKKYIDSEKLAIWGWSYGGFLTLKTLERDAGRTFKYGVAVAPVTDWRYYDSIYTERYMHTPQHNPGGYDNATISDVTSLASNVRFMIMHGVADDNVHMQNTLVLLDKFDVQRIENYDVHVFPDSDHSIYFHNANRIVYDKLSNWLVNAFNGEWLRTANATPNP